MVKEINYISFLVLITFVLMMIKQYILLIVEMIVLFRGKVMQKKVFLLQVEMEKEVE